MDELPLQSFSLFSPRCILHTSCVATTPNSRPASATEGHVELSRVFGCAGEIAITIRP